jgi:hypothetical protein
MICRAYLIGYEPGSWCVVIVPGPEDQSSVLLACSLACAAHLKTDFEWVENED